METLEALFTRRSIRKYKSTPIPEKDVTLLLKAGMYAPTARNTQSNQFLVISDRSLLDAFTSVHPYAAMLKQAPLCIVVCGDKQSEKEENYLAINGSAATQNILLAAHSMGIGSVWLGVYGRTERMSGIQQLFSLPEHIVPISAIALGYPDEAKEAENRFDQNKVHYNKW